MDVYLMDVYLMDVFLMGLFLMNVFLMDVFLMDFLSKPTSPMIKLLQLNEAMFSAGSSWSISITHLPGQTKAGYFAWLAPHHFAKPLSWAVKGDLALADLVAALRCWLPALHLVTNSCFSVSFPGSTYTLPKIITASETGICWAKGRRTQKNLQSMFFLCAFINVMLPVGPGSPVWGMNQAVLAFAGTTPVLCMRFLSLLLFSIILNSCPGWCLPCLLYYLLMCFPKYISPLDKPLLLSLVAKTSFAVVFLLQLLCASFLHPCRGTFLLLSMFFEHLGACASSSRGRWMPPLLVLHPRRR